MGLIVGLIVRWILSLSLVLSVSLSLGLGVLLNVGPGVGLSVRLSLLWYMVGLGGIQRMEIPPWTNLPVNPNIVTTATKATKATNITTIKYLDVGSSALELDMDSLDLALVAPMKTSISWGFSLDLTILSHKACQGGDSLHQYRKKIWQQY